MVLAKALPDIVQYYEQQLVDESLFELGAQLRERYHQAILGVKRVSGRDALLSHRSMLERSIALRNPYVDPINLLQAEFLKRYRQTEGSAEEFSQLQEALMLSINELIRYAKYGLDFARPKKTRMTGLSASDETQFQCVNETVLPMIIRLRQSDGCSVFQVAKQKWCALYFFLPIAMKRQ